MTRRRRNIVVAAAAAVLVLAGRRRIAIAAAVIAAAVLVVVGLGVRGMSGGFSGRLCVDDLDDWSDYCAHECDRFPEDFADGCEAACMTDICDQHVAYLKKDPIWEPPCTDMQGARFWQSYEDSRHRCAKKLHLPAEGVERSIVLECWRAEMEQQCPALTGADWRAAFDAMMNE